MKYNSKKLKKIYNDIVDEEDRQEKKLSLRTELPRKFIKKYIKESDVVLDAGGGTGINAVMMAKICQRVTLVDLSPAVVDKARENVENVRLSEKIDVLEGDISNLERFKDEQFSFTVCVGDAVSYVLDNRFKAIRELVRVTQKDSILVIGCDSKYGFMRESLKTGDLEEALSIYNHQVAHCPMGPKTYTYTVDEMKQLLEENNCDVLEIASTPTISDGVDKNQFREFKKWEKLKKLEMELCTKPELLGSGTHLLFIAKKQ